MPDETLTGLTVTAIRDEEQGVYQLGVELDGYFVVFAQRKLGRIDSQREFAKAAQTRLVAEERARVQAAAEPPPSETPPEG